MMRAVRRMRLWPGGVAGRVAAILIVGLLVAQALILGFYAYDRATATFRVFALSVVDRIDAIVILMEDTPADQRGRLLRAVNSPTLEVALADGPPPPARIPAGIEDAIRDYLHVLGDRPVRIDVPRPHGHWHDDHEPPPDLQPSRRKIMISVGQRDGSWLIFTVSSRYASPPWVVRMVFWTVVSIGIVALIAVWAARRVTAPIARFAEAADRLGVDVGAPPLPEAGPRELRTATRAFNRMQERLSRLIQDRTQMLAAISHDLRTALTRLRLRTDYIADAEQQAKALADLDEMTTMLSSTLSFARDDAAAEARATVDLAALAQSLCDDLADAGQPVRYDGPDRLTFVCRPVALRRALANLIDNAVTYGGEATVTLAAGKAEVALTVADRGPGIPAQQREQVFAPFVRLEGSRSRETGGTGLGLSVARSIVRRHGGDIALEDRPGGGLLVRVTLPRTSA